MGSPELEKDKAEEYFDNIKFEHLNNDVKAAEKMIAEGRLDEANEVIDTMKKTAEAEIDSEKIKTRITELQIKHDKASKEKLGMTDIDRNN